MHEKRWEWRRYVWVWERRSDAGWLTTLTHADLTSADRESVQEHYTRVYWAKIHAYKMARTGFGKRHTDRLKGTADEPTGSVRDRRGRYVTGGTLAGNVEK